ncbi:MAG: serine hydrolase domain-containing protein [Bacteroidota bacterium]
MSTRIYKLGRLAILQLLCLLVLESCEKSKKANDTEQPQILKDNYVAILDSIVPILISEYDAPSAGVSVIRNGQISFVKVYGEHQKGKSAPKNTIYNVASITKPIVATMVMKLVENGDWSLDEPLYHHYLDADVADDPRAKRITTRHCLSHTAGFKNWRWDEEDGKLNINFEPGTEFQYSGEGMELLRKALEAKFNTPLETLMDSIIFEPAGMKDVSMRWSKIDSSKFAKWYNSSGKEHNTDFRINKVNAADDILVTMADLAKFCESILNNDILNQDTYQEMSKPQSEINEKLNQGLGWVIFDENEMLGKVLNHDGGDPGVVATIILLPKYDAAIAISINSDNGANITNSIVDHVFKHGKQIIEGLHWKNSIPTKVEVGRIQLQNYSGAYQTNLGFSITFIVTEDGLMTQSDVFPKIRLWPKSENEFFPLPFELYFNFYEENNRMHVSVLNGDNELEFTGVK